MKIPNTRITVEGDHISRGERNEKEDTLAFMLRVSSVRVPEVRYTIYLILRRGISEALWIANNASHTTSRMSPVTFASYMGSSILEPVSDC